MTHRTMSERCYHGATSRSIPNRDEWTKPRGLRLVIETKLN